MQKVNYGRFINCVSAARKKSAIREISAFMSNNPDVLSLGAGWPNPNMFPFQSAEFTTSDGIKLSFKGSDMKQALQYTSSQGVKGLLNWVKKLHKTYHNPPLMAESREDGFDACITAGCQGGLSKIFEMLCSPGDTILLDDPCYPGSLAMLRPYGYNLVPVETDKHGMKSESLKEIMEQWSPDDIYDSKSNIPKCIYTVPSCGNPTGVTTTLERKKEIYQIARKYDMIIVEDDPYFYLQFGELTPSYQSIDVDGRVLRSDSMSKIFSSGLRVGWVSGASPFIERIFLHQQTTVIHASTLSQVLLSNLLDQWGMEGFQSHIKRVQDFYKSLRDAMLRCLDKHMTGLAEWNIPTGGMFVWMKLNGISDSSALVAEKVLARKVALIPGSVFEVVEGKKSSYCRAAYSFAAEDTIDEALRRLAEIIREELNQK